ncbi:hypothetical protein GE061_019301 [Apolygus lucorum]|uniref:Uncharacterized protein n=1 Tax=Apolygus lucorum TaxID=248454 RepID=A0A8S9X9F8_APOLU|nr:hypothetical protein GE061_019301 [Apolygus lucorum]
MPENKSSGKKVGDFSPDEFAKMMEACMEKKLVNVATKEDLATLKSSIDAVAEENRQLKNEVAKLKLDTQLLRAQVNESRNLINRNKVVVRGMKVPEGMLLEAAVLDLFVNGFKIETVSIIQAFEIRRKAESSSGLIIVEFASYKDVLNVFKNVNKLRGMGIFIQEDVTVESRVKRGILLRIKRHCNSIDERKKLKVKGDILVVEGRKFAWSEGRLTPCDGRGMVPRLWTVSWE